MERKFESEIEHFNFASQDSELAVGAVTYNLTESLTYLEWNAPVAAFNSMQNGTDANLAIIDSVEARVQASRNLTDKLVAHAVDPTQALGLTDQDIELLGESLYRYGVLGHAGAIDATETKIGFLSADDKKATTSDLIDRRNRTFTMFKELQDRILNKQIEWSVWDDPEASTELAANRRNHSKRD